MFMLQMAKESKMTEQSGHTVSDVGNWMKPNLYGLETVVQSKLP